MYLGDIHMFSVKKNRMMFYISHFYLDMDIKLRIFVRINIGCFIQNVQIFRIHIKEY